jgi:hypothetical protein
MDRIHTRSCLKLPFVDEDRGDNKSAEDGQSPADGQPNKQ